MNFRHNFLPSAQNKGEGKESPTLLSGNTNELMVLSIKFITLVISINGVVIPDFRHRDTVVPLFTDVSLPLIVLFLRRLHLATFSLLRDKIYEHLPPFFARQVSLRMAGARHVQQYMITTL